jgi:pimeloyl-ACP methyl ester carboxylesterase
MKTQSLTRARRRPLGLAATLALVLALVVGLPASASSTSGSSDTSRPKPTVVLIHGAFADASGFTDVVANLHQRGYTVYAPANPLRGLAGDADYIRSFLATIPGPIVLAGHSYGGAVITNAATGNPNVKALVYIAAYALDQGESVGAANELGGGSTDLTKHLITRAFPGSPYPDGYIDPAYFHDIFAADLPTRQTRIMAAAQRPAALSALGEPSATPAWKTIPSWYLVAHDDHAIPPQAERAMAARAHAHTVEIASSHVAMTSHPNVVTDLILTAARNH